MVFAFRKFACATVAWLMLLAPVCGQTQPVAARFDVSGFSVLGAPQIAAEEFSKIVAPFIGRQKTAADVQRAQQAVQQAYFDLGHCSTQVTVPVAEPEFGVVTFRLVQSATPLNRDCAPTIVLDQKRAAPPVPVSPGEVATRPLADLSGALTDAAPPEQKVEIARATTTKPLQDGPVTGLVGKRGNQNAYRIGTATATIGIRGSIGDTMVCEPTCEGVALGGDKLPSGTHHQTHSGVYTMQLDDVAALDEPARSERVFLAQVAQLGGNVMTDEPPGGGRILLAQASPRIIVIEEGHTGYSNGRSLTVTVGGIGGGIVNLNIPIGGTGLKGAACK